MIFRIKNPTPFPSPLKCIFVQFTIDSLLVARRIKTNLSLFLHSLFRASLKPHIFTIKASLEPHIFTIQG